MARNTTKTKAEPVADIPIEIPVVDPKDVLLDPRSNDIEFYEREMIAIENIHPNEWNPNEMNEAEFNRLVKEIKDVGFITPLEVVPYLDEATGETRYVILGGEHRYRAAKILGLAKVPCTILRHKKFADKDFQKAMTVRLQVLHGQLNKDKMVKLFQDFAEKYSSDQIQDLFAFTKKSEWEKLVGDTRSNLKKSGMSAELLEQYDKNIKEARTVEDLGKVIQRLYELYKDTVPYGFMVFTWGKKEHVYVAMTKRSKEALDKVVAHCKETKTEINEFLAPAFEKIVGDTSDE